jgi:DnaJ-class molecular chaperone
MPREKKTDFELLMDARYFNKYGDYLFKRLEQKNHYQRLEVTKEASKSDIKKAYFKLALIWHPDNIRKKWRFGFANEQDFTKLVAQVFVLFEEAYKTLTSM